MRPSTVTSGKYIVHVGFDNQSESGLVQRYAGRHGCEYRWEGLKNEIFQSATVIKFASMAVIWNGLQHGTSLASRLYRRRGIPVCYVEWGLLPQAETFSIDPTGFCGDSILARDVSWVTEADMARLHRGRSELQARYPLRRGAHVLAVLQIIARRTPSPPPGERLPGPRSEAADIFWRRRARQGWSWVSLRPRVVALGDHPLRLQPRHLNERALAGALALRVDRATGDLGQVLDRFGIRPL